MSRTCQTRSQRVTRKTCCYACVRPTLGAHVTLGCYQQMDLSSLLLSHSLCQRLWSRGSATDHTTSEGENTHHACCWCPYRPGHVLCARGLRYRLRHRSGSLCPAPHRDAGARGHPSRPAHPTLHGVPAMLPCISPRKVAPCPWAPTGVGPRWRASCTILAPSR